MVGRPRRQYGPWRHLFSGAGSDRRHDYAELRRGQRHRRHPGRQRHHLLLRPADCLPCRKMRHRYRPADPRRRLRLYRLDHHLADLRLLHLHLLRARSGHHGSRAGDVLRHPAPDRLSHQRRRHHSPGDLRHHPDQPLSTVDAAALGRPPHPPLRGDRLGQPAFVYGVAQIRRRTWRPKRPSRSAAVRHRRLGGVFAGGADRRAGRLPAVSAARPPNLSHLMVDRTAQRRPRLDHLWRAQVVAGLVPRLLRAQPWRLQRARRRARAYVSRSVSLRAVAARSGAGADRHLRHSLADQDQRHQRLCRLDRVVELLLAADAQPSRPRGLAGVQRHGGAAADGNRRLQGAGADAGALLQRRDCLGRRAGRRSRHQQAARASPAAHRVQARASLRHQSGRRRRHDDRDHRLDQRVLRPVRTDGEGALGLRGARGRLRHRAPDRMGDRRQILHRAQAQTKLAEPRSDPVLYLRAFVRAGGHGLLPRLCRADLLAVLFARRPLPRSLQAARANRRAGVGDAGQDAAGADLRPDQLAVRALSRRVRGIRRPRRADARADLSADVGDDSGRRFPAVRRAVEGVLRAHHHHRRGGVAVRAGAGEPPRGGSGNAAADHAPDPGNRRAQAHRCRTAARQGSGGIRQPRQEPLCGRPEP